MAKTLIPKSYMAKVDRAKHNLYREKRTTLHPMLAIPIYYRRMFKGDVMNFGIVESILRSEPTFAPLLGNWRLRFEWYFDSDANRYGWVDNNTKLTAEEVMTRQHHTYFFNRPWVLDTDEDFDSYLGYRAVGKSSIFDYMGVPVGYAPIINPDESSEVPTFGNKWNLDFILTYLNIIRCYHINRQFPNIPYIGGAYGEGVTESFNSYSLEDLDNLFLFLRACPNGVQFDRIGEVGGFYGNVSAPEELKKYYSSAVESFQEYLDTCVQTFGGLFCTQYSPNLFENLLSNDQQLLSSRVTIAADYGQGNAGFTIEQFRLKNHLQGLYDKIFVSGGSDRELSRTIWGIESNRDYDIPELLCVHTEIIGTNLVESNNSGVSPLETAHSSEDIVSYPGSMSGNINTRRGAGRAQKFKANTAGSLMCIVSLVPEVDYSMNIERHLLENNFMDEFTPDMARKGFENVPITDYNAIPGYELTSDGMIWFIGPNANDSIVGKQIAWLREMTDTNRVHGEFTHFGEKADWVLRREYYQTAINDGTSIGYNREISVYGNPLDFQYPFVSTDLYSPNFYLQVAIKNDAYRPVPRRFMPNLGN